MAVSELTLAWSEIVFDPAEFYKLIRNTGDAPVTLVFAEAFPPSAEGLTWDVFRLYPKELVNVHLSDYRPRLFIRGKRATVDVLTTLTTLGTDGIAGGFPTITPIASGVK